MEKYALIVAGGSGIRMGTSLPKQFLQLGHQPVLLHTVARFLEAYADLHMVLVLPPAYIEKGRELVQSMPGAGNCAFTPGGETRFHSVKKGLQFIPEGAVCFVHDAVRCLVSAGLIRRCFETAAEKGNAVPAISPADSMRFQTESGQFQPLDRSKVRLIQTPQTFHSTVLKKAFDQPYDPGFTDEASVVEKAGVPIHLIEGEPTNLKITTPLDLLVAEQLLAKR
ncbi:MAG: 2-C-methyl-D-erythritol 4-phosphate cytidylyltransferase [Williamsia sp.]|nr:2-C-methyl-D-erythritol 4-phosphate cytidylyltransferase [Williamsia sp.]